PVFTTPADLKLDLARMKKVPLTVHLGLYDDETSELCQWHIPETHFLEAWGDTRAYNGTVSIIQPLIAPLYNGKSAHELLAAFTDQPDRRGYDIVRQYWLTQGRASLMSAGASGASSGGAIGTNPVATGGTSGAPGGADAGTSAGSQPNAAGGGTGGANGATAANSPAVTAANSPAAAARRGQTSSARAAQAGTLTAGGLSATATRASAGAANSTAPAATPEFEMAWRKALNDG